MLPDDMSHAVRVTGSETPVRPPGNARASAQDLGDAEPLAGQVGDLNALPALELGR